jgi:hypothetical protein
MPKQTEPPAPTIRLSTNAIWQNKFYVAGEALPFQRVEDMPENFKPLVVTGEPDPDQEPNEARGAFQLNVPYTVTDDNRLGRIHKRQVERQVAELQTANEEQDWIEEEVNSAELPTEVAQDLQAEHERDVDMQRAQMAADTARSDAASDAAAAAGAVPTLYVRRGSRHYAPAATARLKAGENVFTRKPDGRLEYVGIVDGHGELPDLPIQL